MRSSAREVPVRRVLDVAGSGRERDRSGGCWTASATTVETDAMGYDEALFVVAGNTVLAPKAVR